MSYYDDYNDEYPLDRNSPLSETYSSQLSNAEIPEDEDSEEEQINIKKIKEKPEMEKFITRYSIFFDNQQVENVYGLIPLNKDMIIGKMTHSVNEGIFLSEYDGLDKYQLKQLNVFKCSENNFRNVKHQGYKILRKGITYFLYARKEFNINGIISDIGVVRMNVNFRKYNYNDVVEMELKIKNITNSMYRSIFGVDSLSYIIKYVDIKFIYREYYLSNDHLSTIVKGELKNNIVMFTYKDIKMMYSSKKENMNFTVRNIEDADKILEIFENIEMLINYIKNNHEIHKNKKIVSNIKSIKKAGLNTNSYKCEKKRQPLLVGENEQVEEGVEVFQKDEKIFRCNSIYPYHGRNGKVDCCYKKKPKAVDIQGGIKQNIKYITKFSALKKHSNLSKYKKSIISDTLIAENLSDKFNLLSVGDQNYEKSLENCLSEMYNIEYSIQNLSLQNYNMYIKNGLSLEEWISKTDKSIDEVLLAVCLTNDVSIIILHSSPVGLKAKCPILEKKSKYVFIQESDGMYFIIIENIINDIIYEFSKDNPNIKNLVNLAKESCEQLSYTSRDYKDYAIKYEILDINNMVIFLYTDQYGIIPVSPSSRSNLPGIKIQDVSFLTPDEQYNKLLNFEHKPIGYTVILDTDIVTGIKLSNDLISPVINKQWANKPEIPKIDELFYIERYFNNEDIFEDENKIFLLNLEKIKEIDTDRFVSNQDFNGLIIRLQNFITDEKQLTKIVWYLLNK